MNDGPSHWRLVWPSYGNLGNAARTQPPIRFDDGEAYERLMGVWSQSVGDVFLDWLPAGDGERWLDVGCGNGAFTEQIIQRRRPADVQGIVPSAGQFAYAQTRVGAAGAVFQVGDAMALPFAANQFDAAVMALVISFVPDPAKAVAEMARVVQPGGLIATYMWDQPGGGSPQAPIFAELRAMGLDTALPASGWASSRDGLCGLWTDAGLERIERAGSQDHQDTRSFPDRRRGEQAHMARPAQHHRRLE
jgi:SAM-dependent methyltransferase